MTIESFSGAGREVGFDISGIGFGVDSHGLEFVLDVVRDDAAALRHPRNEREEVSFTGRGAETFFPSEGGQSFEIGLAGKREQPAIAFAGLRHGVALTAMPDSGDAARLV